MAWRHMLVSDKATDTAMNTKLTLLHTKSRLYDAIL
uniref:Uncharacterized protein n=1 Tax=Anguilla anguilla TaxID=7936 RepID=A0A0E9UPC5_ANGAN